MPPRPTTVDDPSLIGTQLNPAEAAMGQNANGSIKRPREDDEELEDDEEEEGGKKERIHLTSCGC